MKYPNIDAERARRGMKKKEFAAALGVSIRSVINWQKGISELPCGKLIEIAKLFGCSTDYLLGLNWSGGDRSGT